MNKTSSNFLHFFKTMIQTGMPVEKKRFADRPITVSIFPSCSNFYGCVLQHRHGNNTPCGKIITMVPSGPNCPFCRGNVNHAGEKKKSAADFWATHNFKPEIFTGGISLDPIAGWRADWPQWHQTPFFAGFISFKISQSFSSVSPWWISNSVSFTHAAACSCGPGCRWWYFFPARKFYQWCRHSLSFAFVHSAIMNRNHR